MGGGGDILIETEVGGAMGSRCGMWNSQRVDRERNKIWSIKKKIKLKKKKSLLFKISEITAYSWREKEQLLAFKVF